MDEDRNEPIISGPEPSGPVIWWRNLVSAVKAMRARVPAPAAQAPMRKTRKAKTATRGPEAEAAQAKAKALKDWRVVHGPPCVWLAPVFLAFAVLYMLPHLAAFLQPEAPRSMLKAFVMLLPGFAAPVEPMLAGWLWAPLWVSLLAFALRLRAVWVTHLAILDAVGWSMAALVVEGAAWLLAGRALLAKGGFSPAEQDGVWQMMVAEIVFLFLTAVLFSTSSRRRDLLEM